MNWYYVDKGQSQGPVSAGELLRLRLMEQVRPETYVWKAELPDWIRFSDAVDELEADAREEEREEVPAKALPVDPAKPQLIEVRHYAHPARRFMAEVIDLVILSILVVFFLVLYLIVAMIGHESLTAYIQSRPNFLWPTLWVLWVVPTVYAIGFVGRYGATPGKMITNTRIVELDGTALTYGRAVIHYMVKGLFGVILLGLGSLLMFGDRERRSLHDRLLNTRVILSPE